MSRKLKNFNEVVGHKSLVEFLKKHVEDDNIVDVIMFSGRPGIGKSSLAKILACEVACRYYPDLVDDVKKAVIDNNTSTDCVRLYNMSVIQEKEEEIQKVTADLSIGFSKTKRKALILDEAHNMSKTAQDAILTKLEHLDKGLYVFICTTELNSLRPALQSRSKATFNLNGLSDTEATAVVKNCIIDRKLSFDISTDLVVMYIREWAENEPRKMCNLLENFAESSVVKARDLEVFISMTNTSVVIELLKYLYGSMVLGIEYLESIKYDDSFVSMCIEVCKVVLGNKSKNISNKETVYIKTFMQDKDPNYFIRFVVGVAGLSELRKRRVISIFMKSHISYLNGERPRVGRSQEAFARDLNTLADNVESRAIGVNNSDNSIVVPSLDELFGAADLIDDDKNAFKILDSVEKGAGV